MIVIIGLDGKIKKLIAKGGVLESQTATSGSASDITVDDSGFLIIEGTNVQSALDSADARILQNYINNLMLMGG